MARQRRRALNAIHHTFETALARLRMTLLLRQDEVIELLGPAEAVAVTEMVVREEAGGTARHIAPFGLAGRKVRMRIVSGALLGLGRMGLRFGVGGRTVAAALYDADSGSLLALMAYPFSTLRVGASIGLAAKYLARAEARSIGLLGTGEYALDVLRCLAVVRPIERAEVYSPTPEHRSGFATRASRELGMPVTARDNPEQALASVDIVAVATNSTTPVLIADQLRPGTHVTSMGSIAELDGSVFLKADQLVASSRAQEIETSRLEQELAGGQISPLQELLGTGQLRPESIIELGAIVTGAVEPLNGPSHVTLFRESRGGVSDIGLANWIFERALERKVGTEFDFFD